jgi:hypothetical protein
MSRDLRTMSAAELDAINERAVCAKLHTPQPEPEQDPRDICRRGSKAEPVEPEQMELML